jgi:methylthioribose-1-phosphate isomerase
MLTLLVEQKRVEKDGPKWSSSKEFAQNLEANCHFLLSARPTAINLANAFDELREFMGKQNLSQTNIFELENRSANVWWN